MGNIEDSSKINLPVMKPVTQKEIKHPSAKKSYKTDIVSAIHSSKLTCKVEFHKFRPLLLTTETSEDDVPEEEWSITQPQNPHPLSESLAEQSLLEGLIAAEGEAHGRIELNWASFVKIKRRNYLEEYAFVKELGKGAFGSVAKVKMKYGTLFRAVKIIKDTPFLR